MNAATEEGSGNIASRKSIRDVLAGVFLSQAIPEQKGGGVAAVCFLRGQRLTQKTGGGMVTVLSKA